MRINIRDGGFEVTEALRAHVESRIGIALGRFADRIARVTVRFSRADERSGSAGARCQIDVGLHPQSVRAGDTDADLFAAVDHATDRVSRAVARVVELDTDRGGP